MDAEPVWSFELESAAIAAAPPSVFPARGGGPSVIVKPGFCKCAAKLIFVDNDGVARYQCPLDGETYPIEGANTKLYEINTGQAGNLFDALIRSSASDPTNLKLERECPRCLRKITTFLMLGQDEKPFFTCKCGLKMSADGMAK
jgi:DNA-directed RNA polymerase subunit M/transcription elongation factor TFIIS